MWQISRFVEILADIVQHQNTPHAIRIILQRQNIHGFSYFRIECGVILHNEPANYVSSQKYRCSIFAMLRYETAHYILKIILESSHLNLKDIILRITNTWWVSLHVLEKHPKKSQAFRARVTWQDQDISTYIEKQFN